MKIKNYIWGIFEVVNAIVHGVWREEGTKPRFRKIPSIRILKRTWKHCLTNDIDNKTLLYSLLYFIISLIVFHTFLIYIFRT
jgi:hypothetical protein